MVLKWPFLSDIGEETVHAHYSGLLAHRTLMLVELYLRDCLQMTGHSVMKPGEETKLFELVEFYSGDDLEMSDHQFHWVIDCIFIIQHYKGTKLFESVEVYSEFGLEIAVHQ